MEEQYLVILALMVIATTIAVVFASWSNRNLPDQPLAKIQKAKSVAQAGTAKEIKDRTGKNSVESSCEDFIPPQLLSIAKKRYQTSYAVDGLSKRSVWESSSQPPAEFSLKDMPNVFFVYGENDKLEGCGVSQQISDVKASEIKKGMKLIQCPEEKRYFSYKKYKDGAQIFHVLTQDRILHSLRYELGVEINQKNLLCR